MNVLKIIVFIAVLCPSVSMATPPTFGETLYHKIQKDNLSEGGQIVIESRDLKEQPDFFQARFAYTFNYKFLLFKRTAVGEILIDLPISFKSEEGFNDLQRDKVYENEKVKLTHKGRLNWRSYYDCHLVGLLTKTKGRWKGDFIYCPTVPYSGIGEVNLTVAKLPLVGEYTIKSLWEGILFR